jgi:hypothetical protein
LITRFTHGPNELPDLTPFWDLLFDPVRYEGTASYNGYYCATNILREELGLERNGKPGDYDIVFIPYRGEHLFFDRTAVYEVKIVRPSFERQSRSPNSFGETQVYGLLEDGFPLVGLLHVIAAEPLLPQQLGTIGMSKLPAKGGREEGDPPLPPLEELYELQPLDWLPGEAIDRQMRRLITAGFPKYVAINSFAMMQNPDGSHTSTFSREYQGFMSGYFNPQKKSATIAKIAAHFQRYGAERYRRLELWNPNTP